MARGVNLWLGGALACCLLVGVVYLPPRGMPKWAWGSRYNQPPENTHRLRARALAFEWQVANAALVGARFRERFAPVVKARRIHDTPGPILWLEVDDSLRAWAQPVMQMALDSAWAGLGIGVSKVAVGVLAAQPRSGGARRGPVSVQENRGVSYLLPDSTDRSTCLVVAHVPYFATRRKYIPLPELVGWGTRVLGPCAFYARFGVPSSRVERWLGHRQFDVALVAGWSGESRRDQLLSWRLMGFGDMRWWWEGLYSYPALTLACFAGRPDRCRQGFAAADRSFSGPRPRVVVPRDPWDPRKVELVGADWFLSDLLRVTGAERFQEFWTTALPVDSALTVALRRPVGEYTVSWLRRFGPGPHFGAATTPLDALVGIAFAAFLVGLGVLAQGRREVR